MNALEKEDSRVNTEPLTAALTKFEPQHIAAVPQSQPLTGMEMKNRLNLIREVMASSMVEGQDYGKVPGCGDKPGLFQPGAQKLSMMFQLNPEVRSEVINDYPGYHRGFRFVVRVTNGSKFADGVGECSTLESKYRYRSSGKKCPECGKETIIKGKEQYGGGWLCFEKKGGCGWKCADRTPAAEKLMAQDTGKVENENPADYWNTARKMAFKRAFVHAIINATNTSELWSQDLEDLAANGVVPHESQEPRQQAADKKAAPSTSPAGQTPASGQAASGQQGFFKEGPPSEGVTTDKGMMFEEYTTVTSKPDSKTKWFAHRGKFVTDSGSVVEASTLDSALGARMAEMQGMEVDISHRPGRKAGTRELVSIQEADDVAMAP